MKKVLSSIIAVLIIAALTSLSVFAYTDAYPFSTSYDFGAAEGEILKGELYGTPPWGDNMDNTYERAWDGDITTFFDPLEMGEHCYTAVKLSEPYVLTEIRIHPRVDQLGRYNGATIQGSNDDATWTDIYISAAEAEAADYFVIKPADFIAGSNVGYSYYRYVNNTIHGDVAEVELYGELLNKPEPIVEEVAAEEPAAPAEEAPAPAPVVVKSPQTNDNFVLMMTLMVATIIGAFIIMRKRVTR